MVFALCSLDKGDFRESEGWGHKSEQAMPPRGRARSTSFHQRVGDDTL
jgi:hypothetical protein